METKSRLTKADFVPGSAKSSRNLRSFALQMAKAKEHVLDLERGARLRALRGTKRQKPIADFLGVSIRSVQLWEAGNNISPENVEMLATWYTVSTSYILHGREETNEDVAAAIAAGQLDRIERGIVNNAAKLDRLLRLLEGERPPGPEGALGRDLQDDPPNTGSPGQTGSPPEADAPTGTDG